MMRTPPRRQRGIALITALLVVSLATIAAAALLASGSISLHRTATMLETEKAWWYADGVEAWIKTILERDAKDNSYDALDDIWAQPVDYLPVDQGFIRGQITDLQGRFNLNNLGVTDLPKYNIYVQIFERLFEQVEIDPFVAKQIAAAVRDWIDADGETTGADGAEDTDYMSVLPPYRTPNRPMQSVTELMAVKGMTKELYVKLAPYITVLPMVPSPINVNTAAEPLLRALVAKPNPEFENFIRDREIEPLEDAGKLSTFIAAPLTADMLSVSSQFFELRAEATIGNGRVAIYSLYYRPSQGTPLVLAHSTDSD